MTYFAAFYIDDKDRKFYYLKLNRWRCICFDTNTVKLWKSVGAVERYFKLRGRAIDEKLQIEAVYL